MKLLFCAVLLLPSVWAADLKGTISCPDGKECPIGQACCPQSDGLFQCCNLKENERLNKKLTPGFSSAFTSMPFAHGVQDRPSDTCAGTVCSNGLCCPSFKNAACCSNSTSCCANSNVCCSGPSGSWCCPKKTRCAETFKYCIAGAASLSPAIAALLLTLMLIKWS